MKWQALVTKQVLVLGSCDEKCCVKLNCVHDAIVHVKFKKN